MADSAPNVEGDDSFALGANSSTLPTKLLPGQYVMAMNIINRGGMAQTRPGSASLPFDIIGTNLQGITMFQPSLGPIALVYAVDGKIFYSPYPFKVQNQLTELQFSPYSKFIAWASCVQSTDYTPDGRLITLDEPKNVLLMQDGNTRAAYWDGATAGHINPTPSGSNLTQVDRDGTPIGLWMKWSNNRLWVSRRNQVFASDIGNPLKFTETQYLAEARAFTLPGPCTGIVETSDQQGIICFTPNSGVLLRSSIQERTLWLQTPDFQKTILPEIGCLAPRSLVNQHGLVWWYTPRGVINLNDAMRLYISSRLNVQDQEMASSKSNVSYDISGVCGSFYDNFMFHAVPNGHKINTRLHVLDQAPGEDANVNTWPSFWEAWRPVEFARGMVSNQERIFCLSYDRDGKNRIWELFLTDRTDNGVPITCYLETKTHLFQNRDFKKFKYAEIEMNNLSGDVAVMIAAAGVKGGYQSVGKKDITSKRGQVYYDALYGTDSNSLMGSRIQTRVVKSTDDPEVSDCNDECVESENRGLIDKGFSLLIVWSGQAGLSAYRIFVYPDFKAYVGACEDNETGETRLLTTEGCSSRESISAKKAFETFFATATFNRINPSTGLVVSRTATQASQISQEDANRKASQVARWYVLSAIGEII